MEKTFSTSQDMIYSTWAVVECYLGNKNFMETWTIIGESGLGQLLINSYKTKSKHLKKGPTFKHSKPLQEHFNISLILLSFQQCFDSDS